MNFFDCVLDFLFPPVCGICLKRNGKSICDECRKIINYKSINKIEKYKKKYFYKHLYIFKYEGIIRQRLLEYKFKEKAYLYKTFAETIIHDKDNIEYIKKYDILIPVPIHKKRKKDIYVFAPGSCFKTTFSGHVLARERVHCIRAGEHSRNLVVCHAVELCAFLHVGEIFVHPP